VPVAPAPVRDTMFPGPAPKVRWEYHTEVLKADLVPDRLAGLGDAGWELVQVLAYTPTHRELWLKRRR
jgi:hypothetical protein